MNADDDDDSHGFVKLPAVTRRKLHEDAGRTEYFKISSSSTSPLPVVIPERVVSKLDTDMNDAWCALVCTAQQRALAPVHKMPWEIGFAASVLS